MFNFALKAFSQNNIFGNNLTNDNLNKLSWVLDTWVREGEDGKSYERWNKASDSLYEGGSETIKNGDTVFNEKLKLQKIGDEVFYIADVKHNPAPVYFKMVNITDTEAVFENQEHDFPKKITYKNEEGKLHAWIEGPGKNGDWKKIDFYMSKMR
jgi:hypothetical protein